MKYNPDIHHRRSIRMREYDYSANGAYFVTICTQGRESDSPAWGVLIAAKVSYGGGVSDEWYILQETEGARYDQLNGLILPKSMELCIA